MPRTRKERPPDPDRLLRRSAGDLHSEDGRFEVSSAGGAGRWYVSDNERHDGLGLALVLGPFGTLDEVRGAIVAQRATPAGDDQPLPVPAEPPKPQERRARPGKALTREPAGGKAPAAASASEPEPPARPQPQITRSRWRARHDARDEVLEVVRRINDAWLTGDPGSMAEDLHPSVVFVPPEPRKRLEGRDEVADSYRAFVSEAVVRAWTEADVAVDVIGDTAVVRYRFELAWEADGAPHEDAGDDLLVLTRVADRWLVAWRTTLSR